MKFKTYDLNENNALILHSVYINKIMIHIHLT